MALHKLSRKTSGRARLLLSSSCYSCEPCVLLRKDITKPSSCPPVVLWPRCVLPLFPKQFSGVRPGLALSGSVCPAWLRRRPCIFLVQVGLLAAPPCPGLVFSTCPGLYVLFGRADFPFATALFGMFSCCYDCNRDTAFDIYHPRIFSRNLSLRVCTCDLDNRELLFSHVLYISLFTCHSQRRRHQRWNSRS